MADDTSDSFAIRYRGQIIHATVILEEHIDLLLLAHYFDIRLTGVAELDDRQLEFQHTFLSSHNVNLMLKFNSLVFLFEKYCADFLKKCPKTKKGKPKFIKDIRDIIELRNIFAHRNIDPNFTNFKTKEVVFIHHTTGEKKLVTKHVKMNEQELEKFFDKFKESYNTMSQAGMILVRRKTKK